VRDVLRRLRGELEPAPVWVRPWWTASRILPSLPMTTFPSIRATVHRWRSLIRHLGRIAAVLAACGVVGSLPLAGVQASTGGSQRAQPVVVQLSWKFQFELVAFLAALMQHSPVAVLAIRQAAAVLISNSMVAGGEGTDCWKG